MTLKSQMTSDMSVFFNTDDFAESWTYTPNGGEATTITVLVNDVYSNQESYVRGPSFAEKSILVQKSEVSNPVYGDVFNDGTNDWMLHSADGVIDEDNDTFEIALQRIETG